ncbi:trypsin-like serine protease [Bdellovibrio bacteriovorus]|nr:trypsin-like serine protease [Bdellovibrio bacteriovorus]
MMGSVLLSLLMGLNGWALTHAEPAISPDFDSVVFYSVTQYDEKAREELSGFCNGNLVSPRVMITAAHCVFQAEALQKREFDVQIGEYLYVTRPDGERRRVGYGSKIRERIHGKIYLPHQLTSRLKTEKVRLKIGPAEDIAVVVFEQDLRVIPGTVFAGLFSQQQVGSVLSKLNDYVPTVVTINPFEEISTNDTRRMAPLNNISKTWSGYLESKSRARVQPGDSGAPLFVRTGNQWKQIGVVKGRAQNLFSNWDVFGILDQRICEISRQIPDPLIQKDLCP